MKGGKLQVEGRTKEKKKVVKGKLEEGGDEDELHSFYLHTRTCIPPPHATLTLYQEHTTTRSLCDLRSSERLEQSTNSCGCPETCSTGWRPGRKRPPLTRRPVSVCVVCVCVSVCVCVCVCESY